MRDLYNGVLPDRAIRPQTISGSALNSGDLDLAGYDSALLAIDFGDIDEMGSSPVGSAEIACKLEHADDDGSGSAGSYSACADTDVLGHTGLSSGVFTTVTTDASVVRIGYRGGKRFVKLTLTPIGLTNGGPVAAMLHKGHPLHGPVS